MRVFSIYVLIDPADSVEFRYVGVTRYPDVRLQEHLDDPDETYKGRWIRKVLSEGRTPELQIIHSDIESEDEAYEWEIGYIAALRERGHRLTNATDGGDGIINPTAETRTKMSAGMRVCWQNPEYRVRHLIPLIAANKNRVHSIETRARISAALKGKPKSIESRAKLSAARKGRSLSAETIVKRTATRSYNRLLKLRANLAAAEAELAMLGEKE